MADDGASIIKADAHAAHTFRFQHPLGKGGSEIVMTTLARPAGLQRLGVNLGRVPPGKEGFIYHRHHAEEEWVYILNGVAACDIEGETTEVGKGDFIAFRQGVAHAIKNIGKSELLYLMGGEQCDVEVADFPRHGKRMLRAGMRSEIVDADACNVFEPQVEPVEPDDA